jgi:hypothetical protein
MQVHGVVVREQELDEAERIALARRLPDADDAVLARHLVAAPGRVAGVPGEAGQDLVLQDRGRDVPGRVHHRAVEKA